MARFSRITLHRIVPLAGCAAALLGAVAGCGGTNGEAAKQGPTPLPEAPPEMVSATEEKPVPVPRRSGPVVVKEGRAPLAYITESAGAIRVADRTDGRDLAGARVLARTLVRVDEQNGVIFGREQLLRGPLPEGHTYIIYLEPDEENVIRRTTIGPVTR